MVTRKQQKALFLKIGGYVAKRLVQLKETEMYYREIGDRCGIPSNRMSEIVNKGDISYKNLAQLISGGIMTVQELTTKVPDLSSEEKSYIVDNFSVLEDKALLHEIKILKASKENPAEILKRYRLKKGL